MLSVWSRICTFFLVVTFSVATPAQDTQDKSTAVRDVKVGPLQLGMPIAEATRLLHGRGFTERAPGDWQRQDSADGSSHTRFRFDHVDANLIAIQLQLVGQNDSPSRRDGYLRPVRKYLGEPREKLAGETLEDPRVVHVWRGDTGDNPAVLTVDIAKGADRHSLFMTLEYAETPKSIRQIPVAKFPLSGMKLGMTQSELEAVARAAGFEQQGRRYIRHLPEATRESIHWGLGPDGRAVSITLNAGYTVDAMDSPTIGPILKDIEAKLGEGMTDAGIKTEIFDHPDGPKLTVNLYSHEAVFRLAGNPDFKVPPIESISATEHDSEILAAAEA
ncbi:MAG: hypothetical protein CMK32_11070, partial [Porticoccaceae bacterium]|nr:hypothetical protein [Porticoccaceae bacterium]